MKRLCLLAGVMYVLIASVAAQARELSQWNPLYLDTSIRPEYAQRYKIDFEEDMASVGYLYSIPAFLHFRQRYEFLSNFQKYMGDQGNPFGQFLLLRQPTSPATADTMPNYDTLYGVTFLELDAHPVVLEVPAIPDRYYSFALVDSYFYNFDYIGSRTVGQKAGRYLIVGPNWKGTQPRGIDRIYSAPTNSILIYQRIYFRNLLDVPTVNKIQDQIRLVPLEVYLNSSAKVIQPDVAGFLKPNPLTVKSVSDVLRITNQYMAQNPPPVEDRSLTAYFAPMGVGPGLQLPVTAEMTAALERGALKASQTMSALALSGFPVRNGWQIPPASVGERGGSGGMAMQAMIQLRSIGVNSSAEAVYYTAFTDIHHQPLDGATSYRIRFERNQIPPVDTRKFGFWSITIYDRTDLRLISNVENKYLVRSGDPLVYDADGSLTLYIQPDAPSDAALRANWLPSPRNSEFILMLRAYVGAQSIVTGQYVPPAVVSAQ